VERRPRSHDLHDAHHGVAVGRALDINHLILVPHREVDRFSQLLVQDLHMGQRLLPHADARFDEVAELQQADAEPVGAGLDAVDQAGGRP
jgi:hypothetical protein